MANVLEQPMSSQQRQNLANSLMGSIGAVLQSPDSSNEAQSSNDTDEVKNTALVESVDWVKVSYSRTSF